MNNVSALIQSILWVASLLVAPLQAATLTLTINKTIFSSGDTLSLSGTMMPTGDDNVQSDIYVAVVLPSGQGVFTLDHHLAWNAGWVPILQAFPVANIQVPNFYSLTLPAGLPVGEYIFSLTAVKTGESPLNSAAWLGIARMAPITFQQVQTLQWRGVNLSGAEFGEQNLPDIYGVDYIYPPVDYFKSKGLNLVRLPFRWERLQPTLYQPFDEAELKRLKDFVSGVTAKDVSVLLDPHNYARYQNKVLGSEVPYAAFEDFWSRLATLFKDNTKVLFGLMNEPHDMPTETWVEAANAAIRSIRATGATNTIMVPGNGWTGAFSWSQDWYGTSNAVAMKQIVDPGNNLVFEVHQYLDADSSGKSPICVSPSIGVERLKTFTDWLRTNGKRGFLGEFAGANNDICNQAVSNMLTYIESNADVWSGWAWWAAGPWWGDYMFSIEPGSDGRDKPQMAVLEPHLNPLASTTFPQFPKARTKPYVNQSSNANLIAGPCKDPDCLHEESAALKFNYTMPPANWGSYNIDLSQFDASQATHLTLWTKGAIGGERFEVVLWSDCAAGFPGRPNSSLIAVEPPWRQQQIPLADFQPFVNLSSLCRISVAFNDAIHPQGTIYLDKIAFTDAQGKPIYTPDELSLATYHNILAMINSQTGLPHDRLSAALLDIFPQFTFLRSLPKTTMAAGASLEKNYCTDPTYSGKYGLKLTYTMPPQTWGSFNLEAANRFDVSKAKYLEFWAKGEQGNERFETVLWSNCLGGFPGRPQSALISVSQSWTRQRIPLADFQSYVDLSSLCRLTISFNDGIHPGGTIYLDQVAFVDAEGHRVPIDLNEDTNVTNIGLYLADLIGALELGWQGYEDVLAKVNRTLTSIEMLPKSHGFPHTHNHVVSLTPVIRSDPRERCKPEGTPSLAEPNLFSTVDLGNFAAGLILVRQRIPELASRATALLEAMEWDWLYDAQLELLYGCRSNDGTPSAWYYDWLAADSRLAYLIAIGTGDIPPAAWQKLKRDKQDPVCAKEPYFKPGLDGGGLFMAFLPGIFIDETRCELGISACNFARDQICEAEKNGAPVWGWSATGLPTDGEEYCGYGCNPPPNVVAPHASISAAQCVSPEKLRQNLITLDSLGAREWAADGEQQFDFGFRASVDWKKALSQDPEAVTTAYLLLDQSMAFLSLVNEITNGRLRKLFHQDAIVKAATSQITDYAKCTTEPITLYTSSNLTGHLVAAECNPGGVTACPCSEADVSILADQGIVTSNPRGNNTWVNAIGYKKFIEQLPNNQPISLGIYQYQGQFRLPQIPIQDITKDNPEAVHLMIQLWDGRNELLQADKQTLEGTLYWELNPWHKDYKQIKVYTPNPAASPPLILVATGIVLEPNTDWHSFGLIVDFNKQEYVSVTIDGETKPLSGIKLARVHQDWGEDVFLSITTESQAVWPQPDCSLSFKWSTHFRNLELSCLPSCSVVNMDNPPSNPISSPFQVTWSPPEDMVLQIYRDGHLIYDEKRLAGTSFTLSPGRFEIKVWNRGEVPYASVWVDIVESVSSCLP